MPVIELLTTLGNWGTLSLWPSEKQGRVVCQKMKEESIYPPAPDPHWSRLAPWGVNSFSGPGLWMSQNCWESACHLPRRQALEGPGQKARDSRCSWGELPSGYTCTQLVAAALMGLKSWTEKMWDKAQEGTHRGWKPQAIALWFCDFLCVWLLWRTEYIGLDFLPTSS